VLYPALADKESGYVRTLMDPAVFPPGLRGIMLAAFAAAYMSTIGTQLNWGASYVVNDFYRRFVRPRASEREYVAASQAVTVGLMLASIYVTLHLASIEQAWKLLIVTGAGTGTVLLLRWFWWRINAWSEVSAMAVAAAVSLYLQIARGWDSDRPRDFAYVMLVTVAITTIAWMAVTMLTRAESAETLDRFYRRVRPQGRGWQPVARRTGMRPIGAPLARELLSAVLGCVLVYSALFGVGYLLLRSAAVGVLLLGLSVVSAVGVARSIGVEESAETKETSPVLSPSAGRER
jgi:Na+/proline symporter